MPPSPDSLARARRLWVREDLTPLAKDEIYKAYAVGDERYVPLMPPDEEALSAPLSRMLVITECVAHHDVDPSFFEASYNIWPDPGWEKPYYLLRRTLIETCTVARSEWTLRGHEHEVVIRPGSRGLVLHTLFCAHDMRDEPPADPYSYSDEELRFSKEFVNALRGKFDPIKLTDKREDRVRQFILKRGQELFPMTGDTAPPDDLGEALKRSLELRKPVKRERRRAKSKPEKHRKQ